jgi:transcriptional regulator with XRE-family HTH domain
MQVDESTRIRLIRALLGMESKAFAARVGVCAASITNWEKGRSNPTESTRETLQKLCEVHGIWFTPEGYPVPKDCFQAVKAIYTPEQYPTPESYKLNDNYETEGE